MTITHWRAFGEQDRAGAEQGRLLVLAGLVVLDLIIDQRTSGPIDLATPGDTVPVEEEVPRYPRLRAWG